MVPDFALTLHFLHLVFTTAYTRRLPSHSMWWATMLASSALAVALATWGCRYRELQPVFFGGGRILGSGSTAARNQVDVEEGEAGHDMGSSRGRGKDGAGEYEMVHMKTAQ